ncbi:MAG: 30S ribosomal protein S16 [Anaerolineae bacterium]|nr:30S ribosomal protein S16 [Anaerolineae bacterium]
MVKLRLRRVGAKRQASYRIVATDSRAPRDGRFIEAIGFYNPRTEPETVQLKEDRALYWLSVGAQSTDAVTRLLKKMGTLDRYERLKKGESIEALVAEAEAAAEGTPEISPKTRRAAAKKEAKPEAEEPKEAAPAAAEAAEEEAAPEAEAKAEAEPEEQADEEVAEAAEETEAGEEAAEA